MFDFVNTTETALSRLLRHMGIDGASGPTAQWLTEEAKPQIVSGRDASNSALDARAVGQISQGHWAMTPTMRAFLATNLLAEL